MIPVRSSPGKAIGPKGAFQASSDTLVPGF